MSPATAPATDTASDTATDRAGLRPFERSLPMALMRARESVMSRFRPILAAHGLTEQQWRVLRLLDSRAEPCSVGEIVEQTYLLGPSLSRMLASLAERDLIERATSEGDGRRSDVSISTTGRRLVAEIAPESEAAYDAIEERFAEGELDLLHELLTRCTEP